MGGGCAAAITKWAARHPAQKPTHRSHKQQRGVRAAAARRPGARAAHRAAQNPSPNPCPQATPARSGVTQAAAAQRPGARAARRAANNPAHRVCLLVSGVMRAAAARRPGARAARRPAAWAPARAPPRPPAPRPAGGSPAPPPRLPRTCAGKHAPGLGASPRSTQFLPEPGQEELCVTAVSHNGLLRAWIQVGIQTACC